MPQPTTTAPKPPGVSCPFCDKDTLVATWTQKDILGKPEVALARKGNQEPRAITDLPVRALFLWTVKFLCIACGATGTVRPVNP